MSRRVMMVDDSDSDLLFTRLALQRCGVPCEVLGFERAEEALAHLAASPDHGVDLILLDINMPVMDGFAFLEAFESLPLAHRGRGGHAVVLRRSGRPHAGGQFQQRQGLPDQAAGQGRGRRRPARRELTGNTPGALVE